LEKGQIILKREKEFTQERGKEKETGIIDKLTRDPPLQKNTKEEKQNSKMKEGIHIQEMKIRSTISN
jgi:hypothetical protein